MGAGRVDREAGEGAKVTHGAHRLLVGRPEEEGWGEGGAQLPGVKLMKVTASYH